MIQPVSMSEAPTNQQVANYTVTCGGSASPKYLKMWTVIHLPDL